MKNIQILKVVLLVLLFTAIISACKKQNKNDITAKQVIENKIREHYEMQHQDNLEMIDDLNVADLFTDDEKEILSTRHWMFDVNIPVVVSVMRSTKQKVVPFWLPLNGFTQTNLTVSNEMTTYQVWQKEFDAGRVELGINGFANYSLHYFVCVAPKNKSYNLQLSNFYPENQYIGEMQNGAFTYHDWDELVLFDVPDELKGQKLLTTVRGRGTESHLVNAFRKTNYPSSKNPDQLMLTWSADPATTIDIQWRTNASLEEGTVEYREKGSDKVFFSKAKKNEIEDLRLINDRLIHRFSAHLKELKPGILYEYRIAPQQDWPAEQQFTTEADDNKFSWIWFGDTHYSSKWGKLANAAIQKHPDVDFVSIAGDIVSDGTYRNQWDDVFHYASNIISQKPFMNVLGNHDSRSGLGAKMYEDLFSYPQNSPDGIISEHTYSFSYKNAMFLMIDATSNDEIQTAWIEEQLKNSDAMWKFAMFHFPPYNWEEPYYNLQKRWVPLFDKYHVDMVFSGHIHYYMRSNPIKAGNVVDTYKDGTAYIVSIGIPSHTEDMTDEPYAAVRKSEGQYYQYLNFDENTLSYSAINSEGEIVDSLTLKK